jgi:hypothetical protein
LDVSSLNLAVPLGTAFFLAARGASGIRQDRYINLEKLDGFSLG